jgi:hypothetical protein
VVEHAGSSAEDAGNVAAASFEDRESPRTLWWGRRLVPRRRLPNAPSSIATQDRSGRRDGERDHGNGVVLCNWVQTSDLRLVRETEPGAAT